ncbi:unnamed protein product [Microthlaspi erraticum]|uniref:Uncharacterized protein n=1 Tax=Microthlaspi erraticum TaxID=1685480 RepID=A0A6D2K4L4_9BRAS|nr:unnamed protein product [Microthlaspi erraticum]
MASVDPQPIDLSEDELDLIPTSSRRHTTKQPRYSSYEPRERKRRTHLHQTAGQSETRADADRLFWRSFSVPRPTHDDYPAMPSSAADDDYAPHTTAPNYTEMHSSPTEHHVPHTAEPAGSSTIPPYTRESMHEATDSLFQFPY